jgi:hypothetical protein
MTGTLLRIAVLGLAAFLAACTAAPIQSVVTPGYTGSPERMVVPINLGLELSVSQRQTFPPALTAALAACGVTAEVLDARELTLEYGADNAERVAAAASRIGADSRLRVVLTRITRTNNGTQLQFEATLWELPGNRVVWRGTYAVNPFVATMGGENVGVALARLVVEGMARDRVLRRCPAVASR